MRKLILLLLFTAGLITINAYEVLQGPTELLYSNKDIVSDGYAFFGVGGRTFLLDTDGQVVHTWPIGTNPKLLENGNVLDASNDDPSGWSSLVEIDWAGNKVWEYKEQREDYHPHHDWVRIYNKELGENTTLYIANKDLTNDELLEAGANTSRAPYSGVQMDAIVEIDMNGNIIWEWEFFDHMIQDLYPDKNNYTGEGKTVEEYSNKLNINLPGKKLKRDWLHCNSLDYNPESGHIVINSVQGELYVIDHDGTFIVGDPEASIEAASGEKGDFLYRFGDPARYNQGEPPVVLENWDNAESGHKQMGGSHDVHWIDSDLPGGGNIMVFDNGQYIFQHTPSSSVLEINPFINDKGEVTDSYINPPDAGYTKTYYNKDTHNTARLISNQVVWSYRPLNNHGMFSHIGSSGQRLPNGGLFVCSDTEGHIFELDANGELGWEYINPLTPDGPVTFLKDSLPMTNSLFRAYKYPGDYPAFIGRELIPTGTITERATNGLDTYQVRKKTTDKNNNKENKKGGNKKKK